MEQKTKSIKESLIRELGEEVDNLYENNSEGVPSRPTLPLVGSTNVPITKSEEVYYE